MQTITKSTTEKQKKTAKTHPFYKVYSEEDHPVLLELQNLLANSYALMLKTQSFHWNGEGPRFMQMHEMTEKQYHELFEAIDVIAERIRILGHSVSASLEGFDELTQIGAVITSRDINKNLTDLVRSHYRLAEIARNLAKMASSYQDEGTVDLATQQLRYHEKTAWLLRSNLQLK